MRFKKLIRIFVKNKNGKQCKKYNDYIKIALYHGIIQGCKAENGHELRRNFNLGHFKDYKWKLFGDIHAFQYLDKDETAFYASSLIQKSRSESPTEHGFVLLDLNKEKTEFVKVPNEHISYKLKVDKSGNLNYDIEKLAKYSDITITLSSNNKKHLEVANMYRDWGRIGDNSEEINDRFAYNIDGIPYDYKFLYGVLGYNFKSSEMNAAFGLVQLDRFEKFKQIRRNIIRRYFENLKDVKDIVLPDDSIEPNWLAIPLQTNNRFELFVFEYSNNCKI